MLAIIRIGVRHVFYCEFFMSPIIRYVDISARYTANPLKDLERAIYESIGLICATHPKRDVASSGTF